MAERGGSEGDDGAGPDASGAVLQEERSGSRVGAKLSIDIQNSEQGVLF